jgi:hypothetical protein
MAGQRPGGRTEQLPGREAGPPHIARQSPRSGELGLLRVTAIFHPVRRMELAPLRGAIVPDSERRSMGQITRFQETLRRVAMIDEGFVEDQTGLSILIVKLLRCC